MGPGGVVWGKKTEYKKSRETVPLNFVLYDALLSRIKHGLEGVQLGIF